MGTQEFRYYALAILHFIWANQMSNKILAWIIVAYGAILMIISIVYQRQGK